MTDELKQWEYDKGYEKGKKEGAIEELEKIKAEIEEKENCIEFSSVSDVALKTAYIEVSKIIDDHISKLKGENK